MKEAPPLWKIANATASWSVAGVLATLTLEALVSDWPWWVPALGAIGSGTAGYILSGGVELEEKQCTVPASPGDEWITRDQAMLVVRDEHGSRWRPRPSRKKAEKILTDFEGEMYRDVRGGMYDQMALRIWLKASEFFPHQVFPGWEGSRDAPH